MDVQKGQPYPLGATCDKDGTNFALFSSNATAVELCFFDQTGQHPTARIWMPEKTNDVWHAYLPGIRAGQCYGYRVHGEYDPSSGHHFNPHKLLIDPYARQFAGQFVWHNAHFDYADSTGENTAFSINIQDSAPYTPKSVVYDTATWSTSRLQNKIAWELTSIYETHVRGFTIQHPEVPEALRGTFAGLGHKKVIEYIKSLGVTSVELLPVHSFIDEYFLFEKGLSNYWGYNTLGFFAPHHNYLSGQDPFEFKQMVDHFHDAGLEVILDVVYNHTCEGSHHGPTLSFRGIDNAVYYQLDPDNPSLYINDTGCGNTLNTNHPRVAQLVMDSLRYWSSVMGVDGFRFDLATRLGREMSGFNAQSALLQMIAQDPVLSSLKLIAEPWDLGPGGYQLGCFPPGWSEWNDRYRDTVRCFWRGDNSMLPEMAGRLHGSSDIFEYSGRKPSASINFVTSHDGFTLRDLVCYSEKRNEANLEQNQDGHTENFSANYGVEGRTENQDIESLRWRQQRNFIATLIISQGVPMLLAGDEFGRTQRGNNNAYCQDNVLNWIDWRMINQRGGALLAFTKKMLVLKNRVTLLAADQYKHQPENDLRASVQWLNSEGQSMQDKQWGKHDSHVLGYLMTEISSINPRVEKQFLAIFNADNVPHHFKLPACDGGNWHHLIDTTHETGTPVTQLTPALEAIMISPNSLSLLGTENIAAELGSTFYGSIS